MRFKIFTIKTVLILYLLIIPLFTLNINVSQSQIQPIIIEPEKPKIIKNRYGELTSYSNKTNVLITNVSPIHVKHYETKQFVKSVFENHYNNEGYYLIQTSNIMVKIYDYYTVFFDPDGNNIVVKEEKFIVEQFKKNEWVKVDLYNPYLMDLSNKTHYIINKIYDNPDGKLSIKYILMSGLGLKHEINFTSKSKTVSQYRIVMNLNGISDNKLSYGNVTREIKEFTNIKPELLTYFRIGELKEDLRSVENDKLQKISFELTPMGVKTQIVIGNYTLNFNESLFIDPDSDTWEVTASLDDAFEEYDFGPDEWVWDTNNFDVQIVATTTDTGKKHGGCRFLDVGNSVPKDVTIDSALFQPYVSSTIWDDADFYIYGHDVAAPPTFGSGEWIQDRTQTNAGVEWEETSVGSGYNDSPEIKTVIQELVNRGDWGSGDDISLLFIANTYFGGRYFYIEAIDDFTSNEPRLYIEWTSDVTAPTYENVDNNNTQAGDPTLFYTEWTDETELDFYVFGTNNTGSWINETATSLTGVNDWSNITKTLNSTGGLRVEWRIWANDTSNNWNNTGLQFLNTIINYTLTIYFDQGINMLLNGSLQITNGSSYSYVMNTVVNVTSLRRSEFIFYKHVYDSIQTLNNTVYLVMDSNQTIYAYSIQKTWPQIEYYYYVFHNGSHYVAMNGSTSLVEFFNLTSASNVINNCFNAIPSEGGVVHLKEGSFNVTESIIILDNMTLSGEGSTSILELVFDGNATYIYDKDFVTIKELKIDCNRDTLNFSVGVWATNCDYLEISKITVIESNNYSIVCYANVSGHKQNNIKDCDILGGDNYGIYIAYIDSCHITDNYIYDFDWMGMWITYSDFSVISRNIIEASDHTNIYFYTCDYITVSDNALHYGCDGANRWASMVLTGVRWSSFMGNTIYHTHRIGIWITHLTHDVVLANNVIIGVSDYGIEVDGEEIILSGNIIEDWGSGEGGRADRHGIWIRENFVREGKIQIIGNRLKNQYSTGYAVYIGNSTRDTIVTNNWVNATNLDGALYDDGINTIVMHNIGIDDNMQQGIGLSIIGLLFGLMAMIFGILSLMK